MKRWAQKKIEEYCEGIDANTKVETIGSETVITSNGVILVRMRSGSIAVEIADGSGRCWRSAWGPESVSNAIDQALACGGIKF